MIEASQFNGLVEVIGTDGERHLLGSGEIAELGVTDDGRVKIHNDDEHICSECYTP